MRLLLLCFYFPPAGGGGLQRPLKFAAYLPELGIETHVLTPDDPSRIHADGELSIPPQARLHRARYVGPRGGSRLMSCTASAVSSGSCASRPCLHVVLPFTTRT